MGGSVPAPLQAHQRRPAQRERAGFNMAGKNTAVPAEPHAGLAEGSPPRSVQRGDLRR